MTALNSASAQDANNISDLQAQFQSASPKNQLKLIPQLVSVGDPGLTVLMDFLRSHQSQTANVVMGKAYIALYQANTPQTQTFLQTHFPTGILPLTSAKAIDYHPLQQALAQQDFQQADSLTRQKLWELAGEAAIERKWVYFTEVDQFPSTDLKTIDQLWFLYSEGQFGFSVQRKIWLSLGKDFNKLWPKIGWKAGNNWTQYPNAFTWNLSAPTGHLPLSNQLRGVRVIASLFAHPVWSSQE